MVIDKAEYGGVLLQYPNQKNFDGARKKFLEQLTSSLSERYSADRDLLQATTIVQLCLWPEEDEGTYIK
jgi:hypothetical protein